MGREKLEKHLFKYRFIYLFLLGLFLMFFYARFSNNPLVSLLTPFFVLPLFIVYIIIGGGIEFFYNPTNQGHIEILFPWTLLYLLLGPILFSITITSLNSKNNFIKKAVYIFYLIFFTFIISLTSISYYIRLRSIEKLVVPVSNLSPFFSLLGTSIAWIFIFTRLFPPTNKKNFLFKKFIFYILTICEVFIGLLTWFIFKIILSNPEKSIFIGKITGFLSIIIVGFILFLIVESIKKSNYLKI